MRMEPGIGKRLAAWTCGVATALAFAAGAAPGAAADEASEAEHLVKILRTTNKAQTNFYVPRAYEFSNANPFDVRAYVQRMMEIEEGFLQTFVAPDGKSGVFLVVCPEYQIESLDRLMALLDRPGQTTLNQWKRIFVPTLHRSVTDPGFVSSLFQFTGPDAGAFFLADPETNAMRFVGAPSSLDGIEAGLKQLDKPTPQVKIEVNVYEIDLQNDRAIGLDFMAWKNGPGRNLFAGGAFADYAENFSSYGEGGAVYGLPGHRTAATGANAAYLLDVGSEFFDYLAAQGRARALSRATVAVLSDSEFLVDSVERYVYTEARTGEGSGVRPEGLPLDPGGTDESFPDNRTLVARQAEVGVVLEGRVAIGANSKIVLDLTQSISNLAGFDGDGVPLVDTNEYSTTLTVPVGKESVLAGLVRSRKVESANKVPVLGSIPGLGWMFGREQNLSQESLIVSSIRPVRVDDFSGLEDSERETMNLAAPDSTLPALDAPVGFGDFGGR